MIYFMDVFFLFTLYAISSKSWTMDRVGVTNKYSGADLFVEEKMTWPGSYIMEAYKWYLASQWLHMKGFWVRFPPQSSHVFNLYH